MALPTWFRDAPVSVFWDVEGAPPSPELDAGTVLSRVQSAIRSHGCAGALFLTAYGGPSLAPLQALRAHKGISILDFSQGQQAKEDCPHLVELMFWVLDHHKPPGVIAVISEDGSYSPILIKLKLRNYYVIVISRAAPGGTLDQAWDWQQLLSTGKPVPLPRAKVPEGPPHSPSLQHPPTPTAPQPAAMPPATPRPSAPPSFHPPGATRPMTTQGYQPGGDYQPASTPLASASYPPASGPPLPWSGVPFSLRLQLAAVLVAHEGSDQGPMRMNQIPGTLRQRFGTELDEATLGYSQPIDLLQACRDVLTVSGSAPASATVRPQDHLREHALLLPHAAPVLLALYDLQVAYYAPAVLIQQPALCVVPMDQLVHKLAGMPDVHRMLSELAARHCIVRAGDSVALASHPFGINVGTFVSYPTRRLLAPPPPHAPGPAAPFFDAGMPPLQMQPPGWSAQETRYMTGAPSGFMAGMASAGNGFLAQAGPFPTPQWAQAPPPLMPPGQATRPGSVPGFTPGPSQARPLAVPVAGIPSLLASRLTAARPDSLNMVGARPDLANPAGGRPELSTPTSACVSSTPSEPATPASVATPMSTKGMSAAEFMAAAAAESIKSQTKGASAKASTKDFDRDVEVSLSTLKKEKLPPASEILREAVKDRNSRDERVASATCNAATWERVLDGLIARKKLCSAGGKGLDQLLLPAVRDTSGKLSSWKMWEYVKPDAKDSYDATVWDAVRVFVGSEEGKVAVGAAQTRYQIAKELKKQPGLGDLSLGQLYNITTLSIKQKLIPKPPGY